MKIMHSINNTKTLARDKDQWCTPFALFDNLDREFNFSGDVCATDDNALKKNYFTKERSAFAHEWDKIAQPTKRLFINPPYSLTAEFLERSAEQAIKYNLTIVAIVNANTSAKWWHEAVQNAHEVRLITGRISFVDKLGDRRTGNTKGQAIIIFKNKANDKNKIIQVRREDLLV